MDNETLDYREHLEKDAPRLQETLRDTEECIAAFDAALLKEDAHGQKPQEPDSEDQGT